ncbi:HTH domain protein (plasmid) [Halobacillus halophilus DSM 2266]|uniref:HTH domain protein n=1 Tax=Halobacillus halophilus (strain ATCC 35676 / DSM 2266 / JCM 20832 / KCTC 3685 / LMG 17431 / NBRC 102448 / NCIMB 2269) TaxID=866895 RepID=I0JTP5_HALH3|nr:DeoR family transcriptional regulator [Halobacillus halophilus]CCG47518.1 HTH domain protein [Halobacillus halophilus DSM 2266]
MAGIDLFYLRNKETIKQKAERFRSLDDFNKRLREIFYKYADDLTNKKLKEFVKFLSQYSVKATGVSWMKPETMAKLFGVSIATVRRYLSKLKELGIIERIRPEKGTHYITVFTPTGKAEKASDRENDRPELIDQTNAGNACNSKDEGDFNRKETMTFKAGYKSIELKEQRKGTTVPSIIPTYVDSSFIEFLKPFVKPEEITTLWRKAAQAARGLELCEKNEGPHEYIDAVLDAARSTVYQYKRGKVGGSIVGYFYGTVRKTLEKVTEKAIIRKMLLEYDYLGSE